jgi:hypothetical protein
MGSFIKKIVSFIFCSFFFLPNFFGADVIIIDLSKGGLSNFRSRGPASYTCTVTQQQLKEGCSIQLISENTNEVYRYDKTFHPLFLQVQPRENNEPISFNNEPVQAYFYEVSFYSNIS